MTGYRDTFKTIGTIRGAAYDLAHAARGTQHADLATELHDSLCKALPDDEYTSASASNLALVRLRMIADAAKDGASLTWIRAVAEEGLRGEPLASLPLDEVRS